MIVGRTVNTKEFAKKKTLANFLEIFAQKRYTDGRNSSRILSCYGVYTTQW